MTTGKEKNQNKMKNISWDITSRTWRCWTGRFLAEFRRRAAEGRQVRFRHFRASAEQFLVVGFQLLGFVAIRHQSIEIQGGTLEDGRVVQLGRRAQLPLVEPGAGH